MVFRRSFLKSSFFLSSACLESTLLAEKLETLLRNSPRARFWVSADSADGNCQSCHENTPSGEAGTYAHRKGYVKCLLCAQNCVLAPGERGKCRARLNVNGELRSLVYGRPITQHLDPIEKKPFYHFLPGSMAYSLATSGCPLRCRFCQNWEISQASPEDYESPRIQPVKIAEACLGKQAPILAFTYNEPTVFTEYLLEIAQAASRLGIYSVMISCGFMNPLPLRELCQNLQAIKIDLKGFSPEFYQNICSANLAPVLRSIRQIARSSTHLEIVNLVVPTLNDSDPMLKGLLRWVMDEIGPDVPLHFTRFHPDYQLANLPPTPIAVLERAWDIAKSQGLRYAYVGNVPGHRGNHTYCPGCQKIVVRRSGIFLEENLLKKGRCPFCDYLIRGVWSKDSIPSKRT